MTLFHCGCTFIVKFSSSSLQVWHFATLSISNLKWSIYRYSCSFSGSVIFGFYFAIRDLTNSLQRFFSYAEPRIRFIASQRSKGLFTAAIALSGKSLPYYPAILTIRFAPIERPTPTRSASGPAFSLTKAMAFSTSSVLVRSANSREVYGVLQTPLLWKTATSKPSDSSVLTSDLT